MPEVSIIIRSKNEAKWIGATLKKIFSQRFNGLFEVILIDSGSTDGTVAVSRQFPIRLIQITSHQFTYGATLNLGARHASGRYLINLSAHCLPANDEWLANLIEPLADHSVIATFGRQVPFPKVNPYEEFELARLFPPSDADPATSFSNANCAFKKTVWQQQQFNETATFQEDKIWYRQVVSLGEIEYAPRAVVFHSHPLSIRALYRRSRDDGMAIAYGRTMHLLADGTATPRTWRKMFGRLSYALVCILFLLTRGYVVHCVLFPVYRGAVELGYYRGKRMGRKKYADATPQPGVTIPGPVSLRRGSLGCPGGFARDGSDGADRAGFGNAAPAQPSHSGQPALVSIILLTKNGSRYLSEGLKKIFSQRSPYPYEVLAIDSGSRDGTIELLARYPVKVAHIPPEQFNHGQTRNRGVRLARSRYIVFLSQDATPADQNWMRYLIEPLERDAELCATFSRHQPRVNCQPILACHLEWVSPLGSTRPRVKQLPAGGTAMDLSSYISLSNTSAAYVRELLIDYPFKIVDFAEDARWELTMLLRGYKTMFQPLSVVYHSHDFPLREQLRQSFDRGRAMELIFHGHRTTGQVERKSIRKKIISTLKINWAYLKQRNDLPSLSKGLWFGYGVLWNSATMFGLLLGARHRLIPYQWQRWLSRQERMKLL